jgi:hypothetical protein
LQLFKKNPGLDKADPQAKEDVLKDIETAINF